MQYIDIGTLSRWHVRVILDGVSQNAVQQSRRRALGDAGEHAGPPQVISALRFVPSNARFYLAARVFHERIASPRMHRRHALEKFSQSRTELRSSCGPPYVGYQEGHRC